MAKKKTAKSKVSRITVPRSYLTLFPEGCHQQDVERLYQLVKRCEEKLNAIQRSFRFPSLRLSRKNVNNLAEILVDFVLDVHAGSGLWAAIEHYHCEFFGTPLPIVLPKGKELPDGICPERVHFLLWNIYPQLDPHFLSHKHEDLLFLVSEIIIFLQELTAELPNSPMKTFLNRPNDYAWDVKHKLIWMGMKSYLFRFLFQDYIQRKNNGRMEIGLIDDFICQETTSWSGLGVIDVLAECIDITPSQKKELRSWYLRHVSIYHIVEINDETLKAVNMIDNSPYQIRYNASSCSNASPFKKNAIIYGSLTPWCNEWYWSGEQRNITQSSQQAIRDAVNKHKSNTQIVGRFWKKYEERAKEFCREEYERHVGYYKNDLVIFPNSYVLEREEIKRLSAYMKSVGQWGQIPRFSIAEQFHHRDSEVGVYFDPMEGMEMIENFHVIRKSLKKNGSTCTSEEKLSIQDWVMSEAISTAFIRRALKEYGGEESVKYAFCLETNEPCWLDYLLRCTKGIYYRKRFPPVSFNDFNDDD
jgi:hypothetical protein